MDNNNFRFKGFEEMAKDLFKSVGKNITIEDIGTFINEYSGKVKDYVKHDAIGSINIKNESDKYTLYVLAPGYNKNDITIELIDNEIHISSNTEVKNEDLFKKEFSIDSFSRKFKLPKDATKNVTARMNNGILEIQIIKDERMSNYKINIM